jgi:hypothetical protein
MMDGGQITADYIEYFQDLNPHDRHQQRVSYCRAADASLEIVLVVRPDVCNITSQKLVRKWKRICHIHTL